MKRFSILYLGFVVAAIVSLSCNACSSPAPQHISDLPSQFITIADSVSIHYKVWDNNEPDVPKQTICFVHGFGCDVNTWDKQFEGLRDDNMRLVFIDLPGYGLSSKPHIEYTLGFFAHAVDQVLNHLNVGPAIMVGHSLGTPVCRLILLATPHISGMIDIDGVYCFYEGATAEYEAAVQEFGSSFDGDQCYDVICGFIGSLAGPDTPDEIKEYAMSTMPSTPEYVASSTMHNLINRMCWPQFALPLDVAVICTQNSGLEPDNRQKMEALYPQVDYTELTTCGHFIHMEKPELVNGKIREYASLIKQNALDDYDFAIRNIEENYAGFPYKVTDGNRSEWNNVKTQLRDSVATGGYSPQVIISDICCWFKDYHLSCTFRQFSDRFPLTRTDYNSLMSLYAPSKLSSRVDDDTWLLRFPTWMGDDVYCQWVKDAVDEYRRSGCSRLIVDLRGNSGGNDYQYSPLFELLYLQPGKIDGMLMRNTKDNLERTHSLTGDGDYWEQIKNKCESDTSAYVLIDDDEIVTREVDPARPKQTAIIIDKTVASSSEQLILDLRATAPDIRLYGKDNTLGCIDISNIRIAKLPHGPNALHIPVTVSNRLVNGVNMIDGIGIAPDVMIDIAYPDTLTDNIDTWVTWVKDNM